MRFEALSFALFFGIVAALHAVLPWRRALLLVASYLFYASWSPAFVPLLAFSTVLDFHLGRALGRPGSQGRRRALLGLSLAGNLGILGYFKYARFFAESLSSVGLIPPGSADAVAFEGDVPIGLSFYTFQTLSYTIDRYRGQGEEVKSPLDFALFVAFFPQLLAGPIVRASELVPQFHERRRTTARGLVLGLELLVVGLFKKVVIADNLRVLVDYVFTHTGETQGASLWVGAFAWSAYIYADFSGYSTMARGLARVMGYDLPKNFDYPLLAPDPVTYRKSWHLSMAKWFRDYVYRPMGGDRQGELRTAFNGMFTWLLFGLWHGPAWTFVAWGAYGGALLVPYRFLKGRGWLPKSSWPTRLLARALFVANLNIASVIFRADTIPDAIEYYHRMFVLTRDGEALSPLWGVLIAGLAAWHAANKRFFPDGFSLRWPTALTALWFGAMAAALTLLAGSPAPFYYFQF